MATLVRVPGMVIRTSNGHSVRCRDLVGRDGASHPDWYRVALRTGGRNRRVTAGHHTAPVDRKWCAEAVAVENFRRSVEMCRASAEGDWLRRPATTAAHEEGGVA